MLLIVWLMLVSIGIIGLCGVIIYVFCGLVRCRIDECMVLVKLWLCMIMFVLVLKWFECGLKLCELIMVKLLFIMIDLVCRLKCRLFLINGVGWLLLL